MIYGVNPVLEALRARQVREVRVSDRAGERVQQVIAVARQQGVPVRRCPVEAIERETHGGMHQGVVATLRPAPEYTVGDLVRAATGAPLLVVLDGVEDPHNAGAILRTADAAGAHGLIQQTRRAASLKGAVAKTSAGALAHVRIARVVNIARALGELKELGVWTVGLAGDASTCYDEVDYTMPTAFVCGAEGAGLRRLVRERCDWVVSIPMQGHVGSLNVSVAAGIALFEAVRQRRSPGAQGRAP